jgi:hypothetical protein
MLSFIEWFTPLAPTGKKNTRKPARLTILILYICGGHVLRETTSRGLCGLGCPSRASERGGERYCVKEGGGGEGKCERERALERQRYYSPGH